MKYAIEILKGHSQILSSEANKFDGKEQEVVLKQLKDVNDAISMLSEPCEHHSCSQGEYRLENYCNHPNAWYW